MCFLLNEEQHENDLRARSPGVRARIVKKFTALNTPTPQTGGSPIACE